MYVCGVCESSPHAGGAGLSGLNHMCLAQKKKLLEKDTDSELQKKKRQNPSKEAWRGDIMFAKRKIRLLLEGKAVKTKDYSLISGPQLWPLQ